MNPYLIEWIDACHFDDERNISSEEFHCVIIQTVGFLIDKNETEVSIAMDSIPDKDRVRNITVIPIVCIQKMVKLKA